VPNCSGCSIQLNKLVTLGSASDSLLLDVANVPVRDSRGRFFMPEGNADRITVFDGGGRLIRSFGRRGDGPGEFSSLGITILRPMAGDSIRVIQGTRSLTFGPDFVISRSAELSVRVWDAALTSDGHLVVAGAASSRSDSVADRPLPLHIVDARDRVRLSFGYNGADSAARCGQCRFRAMTLGRGEGYVVAVPQHRYEIEWWDRNGVLLRTLTLKGSSWHDEWDPQQVRRPGDPMPLHSMIREVWEDSSGLIWVRGDAPDPKYRGGFDPPPRQQVASRQEARAEAGQVTGRATWSTVIDVIDPGARALVAHARFESRWFGMNPDGLVFRPRTLDNGFEVMDVWTLEIRR
jgi:hypothetical protein